MTKKIILLLAIFSSITATINAQEYFYYKSFGEYNYDWAVYNPFSYKKMARPKNLFKEFQLKEQKKYCQNFKKDTTIYLSEQKLYNNSGYETLVKRFSRKGKIEYHNEKKYSEKEMVIMDKYFNSKGKPFYWMEFVYDEKGSTTENKNFNKNGMLIYHTIYKRNEDGKTSESNSYCGKKHKLTTRMVYTYYPNGEKESTTKFNGKGKIEKVWSYACSAEGTEIRKMKDTVRICKISDYNKDGIFTITNRTINEDGKLEKTISKFTKDSIQIEATRYDDKDRLVYKSNTQKTDNGWVTEYTNYYVKKAKPRTKIVNLFNNDKELINEDKTYYKRNGNILERYNSDYKGINQCLKTVDYKKGGEKIYKSTSFAYSNKRMLNEVSVFDEKGIIKSKILYQYQ